MLRAKVVLLAIFLLFLIPQHTTLEAACNSNAWTPIGATGGKTIGQPSAAEIGTEQLITVRGSDDWLYTSTYSLNTNNTNALQWQPWLKDPIGQTLSSPVTTQFKGKMYQAVQGKSDFKIYIRSSANGINWSSWTADPTSYTPDAVSLIAFNDQLYEAARGTGDKIYTRSTTDGLTWGSWVKSGGTTPSAIAMTVFQTQLYQSVRGSGSNHIFTRTSSNGTSWSNWEEDTNSYTPDAISIGTVRLVSFQGESNAQVIFQAARGTFNQVYYRYKVSNLGWSSWRNEVPIPCTNILQPTVSTFSPPQLWSSCYDANLKDYHCLSLIVRTTQNEIVQGFPVVNPY